MLQKKENDFKRLFMPQNLKHKYIVIDNDEIIEIKEDIACENLPEEETKEE